MRKLSLCLSVVLFVVISGTAFAQNLKLGYVDAQKVLETSKEGKRVKTNMEEFVKSRQKIIDLEEQELKQLEEDLVRQGALLSPEAKKVKQDDFQKKLMEYQKKATELNKEVQGKKFDTLRDFNKRLEEAVRQIAEKEGYSIVLDKNSEGGSVLYAKETFDITPKVIEQVDRIAGK
ncbi:MAG: OmpH family outer membrane protein [Candidatus Manganitrophaceae bacterium]|nr:MAG: OmpH family outer membrane protein [Candidatus Manganitrophaceae bacterium]